MSDFLITLKYLRRIKKNLRKKSNYYYTIYANNANVNGDENKMRTGEENGWRAHHMSLKVEDVIGYLEK